jgi:hypothetical protein
VGKQEVAWGCGNQAFCAQINLLLVVVVVVTAVRGFGRLMVFRNLQLDRRGILGPSEDRRRRVRPTARR